MCSYAQVPSEISRADVLCYLPAGMARALGNLAVDASAVVAVAEAADAVVEAATANERVATIAADETTNAAACPAAANAEVAQFLHCILIFLIVFVVVIVVIVVIFK